MKLDWNYNHTTRIARVDITATLYYETPDGGQTIKKFEDGQLTKTFHKYGEDKKYLTHNPNPDCGHDMLETIDPWPDEMKMLCATYPEIVGEEAYSATCLTETGETETRPGIVPVVSNEIHVSINRMGIPGSVQGWWDWEKISESPTIVDDTCVHGVVLRKHKITGKIVRSGQGHPQIPCCMWPMIHYEEINE